MATKFTLTNAYAKVANCPFLLIQCTCTENQLGKFTYTLYMYIHNSGNYFSKRCVSPLIL